MDGFGACTLRRVMFGRGLLLSAACLAVACSAPSADVVGCDEGTEEVDGVCSLLVTTSEGGSVLPQDSGSSPDTGDGGYVSNPVSLVSVSLSGTVAGYFDGEMLGSGTCLQLVDRGSLYVLGAIDVRAEAVVASDGTWSVAATDFNAQLGPLIFFFDCEGSPPTVYPSAQFLNNDLFLAAGQDGHIDEIVVSVLRFTDIEAINLGLLGLSMPEFDTGLFGRVLGPTGEPLPGARVGCADGVCSTVYPLDDPASDHVFLDPDGAALEATSNSGRFLVPQGTINIWVVEQEDFETQTVSTGTVKGIALFQDFQF